MTAYAALERPGEGVIYVVMPPLLGIKLINKPYFRELASPKLS